MQGEDGTLGLIGGAGGRVRRVEMVQHGRAGIREHVDEQARARTRIGIAVRWRLVFVLREDGAGGNGSDARLSQA